MLGRRHSAVFFVRAGKSSLKIFRTDRKRNICGYGPGRIKWKQDEAKKLDFW